MAWVRVDDNLPIGDKVSRAAVLLGGKRPKRRILACWIEAVAYCNRNLTDGFVPDYIIGTLDDEHPSKVFEAMAVGDARLGAIVERTSNPDGWVFRNYTTYQPSKAETEAKLAADRERKRGRFPSGIRVESKRNPEDSERNPKLSSPPGPARPDPARSEPSRSKPSRKRVAPSVEFDACWQAYPRKVGKAAAWKAWQTQQPPLEAVLAAIAWQRRQPQWAKDGGQFVPHMSTWLNQRRWEDEPMQTRGSAMGLVQVNAAGEDWSTECARLHASTCNGRATHAVQLRLDAGRATA